MQEQKTHQLRRRRKRARGESCFAHKRSDTNDDDDEGHRTRKNRLQSSRDATLTAMDFHCQDDDALSFLDKDGDVMADSKCQFMSLPFLLDRRRSGSWTRGMKKWQYEALFNFTKKPVDRTIGRRQWRPYAKSSSEIKFTQLGTPPSDAVLALERKGSYVLSLGSKDEQYNCPGLALRFYGKGVTEYVVRIFGGRSLSGTRQPYCTISSVTSIIVFVPRFLL